MGTIIIEENVIGDSIRELIEKLKSDIDLDQVKAVCKDQYGIETTDRIDLESGDIVNYNGQIAFKLDLKICFALPMLIDRKGNCIKVLPTGSEKQSRSEERSQEDDAQAASIYSEF